jgi:hypothetical protein
MLSVVMLTVVMLSVVMLNVVAPGSELPEEPISLPKSAPSPYSYEHSSLGIAVFITLYLSMGLAAALKTMAFTP